MRVRTGSSVIGMIRRLHPEPRRDLGGHLAEPGALGQAQGAVQVGGQVAVAEAEPGVPAVGREALQAAEGVVAVAPAALGHHPGEDVGADVEVRAHAQAVEVGVVAGVAHHHEARLAVDLGQTVHHLGAAGAPRQGQDHGRRAGAVAVTEARPSLPTAPRALPGPASAETRFGGPAPPRSAGR